MLKVRLVLCLSILLGSVLSQFVGARVVLAQAIAVTTAEPMVWQTKPYSCGAAVLATLLTYFYGMPVTEGEILERAEFHLGKRDKALTLRGLDALSLKEVLLEYGVAAQGIRVDLLQLVEYFEEGGLPLIAQVTFPQNHYVLFVGIVDNRVVVADPWLGYLLLNPEQLLENRGFTGFVLVPQVSFVLSQWGVESQEKILESFIEN